MQKLHKSESKSDFFTRLVESVLGVQVVKEYKFHPTRKWRIDYYIPEYSIAIEVEGGAFTQGRHTRGAGFIADMEKYNTMTCMGIRLIRTTPDKLNSNETLKFIAQLMSVKY